MNYNETMDPDDQVPAELQQNLFITSVDRLYNLVRQMSIWPMMFGLACCAIEMICTAASRFDLGRFGMEVMRPSPRQSDLMIVSGTVTKKMVPQIVRIYNQMAEPRYVLAMGACATGGGPFKEGYNVVSGIDKFIPVDVYVPGCPPTPEALLHGILKLREKIARQSIMQVPWYRRDAQDAIPVPVLGPDIFDPRREAEIRQRTLAPRPAAEEAEAVKVEAVAPEAAAQAAPRSGGRLSPEEIERRRQAAQARRAQAQQQGGATEPAAQAEAAKAEPAAQAGGKLSPEEIERRRQEALRRRAEILEKRKK
jgi:NADH-quinone oxidoreductase subunit B